MVRSENLSSVNHAFQEVLQLCETVAKSKATVLISGEAGSGKRSLAKYIHQHSQRALKSYQTFNCKELSKGEQEQSFVSALESSRGGTLAILEISLLPLSMQLRLVQGLQENSDLRLIATTSKNLNLLVKQNEFREDLFYRLNVVNMKVPNLSERMGDIAHLAQLFAARSAEIHGRPAPQLSPDAIQLLNSHRWPGNIRELESTIERAVLLQDLSSPQPTIRAKDIQIQNLAHHLVETKVGGSVTASSWMPGRTLDEIERNVILEALKHHDGNRTHTAKALGISIRTLRNKLAEYRVMGINA